MSGTEILLAVVLLVALPLRVVLNIVNIASPKSNFDAAYAVLFFVVGMALFVENTKSNWGYLALGISVWYLVSFLRKRKTGTKGSGKQENT